MIVCDTGPLVAVLNAADKDHERCTDLLETHPGPLLVPSPIVAEVCHMAESRVGLRLAEKRSIVRAHPSARRLARKIFLYTINRMHSGLQPPAPGVRLSYQPELRELSASPQLGSVG